MREKKKEKKRRDISNRTSYGFFFFFFLLIYDHDPHVLIFQALNIINVIDRFKGIIYISKELRHLKKKKKKRSLRIVLNEYYVTVVYIF